MVTTRLADRDQLSFCVSDFTQRPAAINGHAPHFGRRKAQGGKGTLFCHQLNAHAGTPCQLSATSGLQLDVMDYRANRNEAEGQSIARPDVSSLATLQHIAHD